MAEAVRKEVGSDLVEKSGLTEEKGHIRQGNTRKAGEDRQVCRREWNSRSYTSFQDKGRIFPNHTEGEHCERMEEALLGRAQ